MTGRTAACAVIAIAVCILATLALACGGGEAEAPASSPASRVGPTSTPAGEIPTPTPAQTDGMGQIAFIGEDGNVHVISPDGTNLVQLTTAGGNSHPAWSPNRSEIAFVHTSSPGEDVLGQGIDRWEIRSVKADVSEERILVPPLEDATYGVPGPGFFGMFLWPRWSPAGDSVYFHFSGGSPGRHRLVAWSLRPLADSPRILRWEGSVGPLDLDVRSSDGALVVAYISNAVGQGVDLIDSEGAESGHTCGPTFEGPSYRHPRWSPDGSRIALWIEEPAGSGTAKSTLAVIDEDCTRLRNLAIAGPPDQAARESVRVVSGGIGWSPDGSRIVYSVTRERWEEPEGEGTYLRVSEESDIYVIPADGSGPPARLTEGRDPTW